MQKMSLTRIAEGYYRPRPYIDGSVTVVNSDGTLFSLSLSDGSVDELWDGLPGNGRYGWVVDNNQLFFLAGGETGNTGRLHRRDLESGETEALYSGPMPLVLRTNATGR